MSVDPLIAFTLRAALAALFGSAAVHKLREPSRFAEILRGYGLLPEGVERAAGVSIGVLEVLAAVAFLVPGSSVEAGLLGTAILAIYTGAIAINLARGRRDVDCGCFGPAARAQPLSEWLLVRNVVVIAAALVVVAPVGMRSLGGFDAFVGVAACAGMGLLWMGAGQLMAQWPRMQLLRRSS